VTAIAVGIRVAPAPPHRSVREELPHTAPTIPLSEHGCRSSQCIDASQGKDRHCRSGGVCPSPILPRLTFQPPDAGLASVPCPSRLCSPWGAVCAETFGRAPKRSDFTMKDMKGMKVRAGRRLLAPLHPCAFALGTGRKRLGFHHRDHRDHRDGSTGGGKSGVVPPQSKSASIRG